jgi:ubiquinol-cytochrome c reductase cytochrome c subunit
MTKTLLALVTLAALALGGCSPVSQSTTTVAAGGGAHTGDKDHGKIVFSMNCAQCHGADGAGGDIGPSLRGEHDRLDYSATVSWIEDPQAPMPKLYPKFLTQQQLLDVAAYVQSL